MSSTININKFIKKHPLKYDSEKVMDVDYGKEFEENHLTTTYKSTETIRTDTRLKKLYHTIMDEAISEGATDIQIADWGEYGLVRFRLGSEMKPYRILHKYAVESLITVFRDKAGTNPESKRTANIDGTIEYVFNDVKYDTRLAFSPTIRGSMTDIRILYPNRMNFTIDDLGMSDKVAFAYKEAIKSTEGLILVSGPTGSGKGLALDTKLPLADGGLINMGDLQLGDTLLDEKGNPTVVTAIYDHTELPCYELTFSDGTKVIADEEHNWFTSTRQYRVNVSRNKNKAKSRKVTGSEEIISTLKDWLDTVDESSELSPSEVTKVIKKHTGIVYTVSGKLEVSSIKGKRSKYYNAKQLLSSLIERLSTPVNDQRHKVDYPSVKTTKEIVETLTSGSQGHKNHAVQLIENPIVYSEKDLPIHPYMLGIWLGDGTSYGSQISFGNDLELVENVEKLGYKARRKDKATFHITDTPEGIPLHRQLRLLGLLKTSSEDVYEKFIPEEYLYSSIEQRREIVSGLLDTDGHAEVSKGGVSFTNTSKTLIDNLRQILHSLGYQTAVSSRIPHFTYKGERRTGKRCYTIIFFPKERVFTLTRKRTNHKESVRISQGDRQSNRFIVDCKPVESVPTRCITVDSPSHLFLITDAYIVTHNTTTEFTGIHQILLDSEFTKNIMTIENPVEYRMEGVIQSSVNPLQGYTFPVALRTMLRQDPNVILVGEINDTETATTAIRAASSGHLVFTTVHANNVLEVSNALNQLGVSDRELGNAMRLILYQTLKDKLCHHCRRHKILRPEQKQWMDSKLLGQPAQAVYFSPNPEGCEHCNHKGYSGRVMLVEMIETNYIYRMLREEHGRHIDGLRNALLESEDSVFYPLEYDVYRHLKEGNISFEDATGMVGK